MLIEFTISGVKMSSNHGNCALFHLTVSAHQNQHDMRRRVTQIDALNAASIIMSGSGVPHIGYVINKSVSQSLW